MEYNRPTAPNPQKIGKPFRIRMRLIAGPRNTWNSKFTSGGNAGHAEFR